MNDNYDFNVLPVGVVCKRCGAVVSNRDVHDEWHSTILTRDDLADRLERVLQRMRGEEAP